MVLLLVDKTAGQLEQVVEHQERRYWGSSFNIGNVMLVEVGVGAGDGWEM